MNDKINILAIGDIVGRPGREFLDRTLLTLKKKHLIDFVIANGENAAGGNAITPDIVTHLLSTGVDLVTTGNHVWNNREILKIIDTEYRLLRPANFPEGVRGKGYYTGTVNGTGICVINLMGRVHLNPIDCPFKKFDEIYSQNREKADIFVVDFHAEATSEKKAFGWYVDGRASCVFGTHTHVQTADETVLPGGTGYITDIGMTGSFDSVIGMDKTKSIERFLTQTKVNYEVALGNPGLNGIIFSVGRDGKTRRLERLILP